MTESEMVSPAHRKRFLVAFSAMGFLTAFAPIGCGRGERRAADDAGEPPSAAVPTDDEVSAADVELRVVTPAEFEQTLEELRGRVVLVDFWATWCSPCVAQFPHTVELSRRYGDEGLEVVSMSLDEPDDEPQVREFLQNQGADFVNLLSSLGVGAEVFERFELDAIPHYRLYDREGRVQLDDSGSPEELELDQRIAELLAESE